MQSSAAGQAPTLGGASENHLRRRLSVLSTTSAPAPRAAQPRHAPHPPAHAANTARRAVLDEFATSHTVPDSVDCFGLGSLTKQLSWLFNMRPDSSDAVLPGQQFGLEWVDFKPNRRTIMIVHGFMSHSNASVNDSLKASCDRIGSCSEMGIKACGGGAMPGALGPYFVLTTEKVPYCHQNMYCNYTGLNCLITFEANKKNLVIDKPTAREQCLPSCLESELTM
ncbi:hypothetical protein MSG28_000524, partial [Choristoneura fumiferana]